MGLASGFVFPFNVRGALAVLAIALSVSYTLVAGAVVTGLKDSQESLAANLQDTHVVVMRRDGERFELDDLPRRPSSALAFAETPNGTIATVRVGRGAVANETNATAGPSTGSAVGQFVNLTGHRLLVNASALPPGAPPDVYLVEGGTFEDLGGDATGINVASYFALAPEHRTALRERGFLVEVAPAAVPFYTAGALQLVSAVRVTVLASAVVVGLLTSSFVLLEMRARERSFATLRVYAGGGLVGRLAAARGSVLLLSGHLLGLGACLALLVLINRSGALALRLDLDHTRLALAATFLGGLLGLVPASIRAARAADAARLQESAKGPRALRPMLATWRTAVPLAVAVLVLASSLGVVFGVVDMPRQLFGAQGTNVLTGQANNPLRGTVDEFLGLHLDEVEGFAAASPEIFAPTTINGFPAMVRGVAWEQVRDLDYVALLEGEEPVVRGDAVAGARLAERAGLSVGDRLSIPSPYGAWIVPARVVGVADAGGLLADELLVTLDTAQHLTGLADDRVNIIRFRYDEQFVRPGRPPPGPPTGGIEVIDLRLEPESPLPDQGATATVTLLNFAPDPALRHLTLHVNGEPVADAWVALGAHERGSASLAFTVPLGTFLLQVNPELAPEIQPPAYALEASAVALVNETIEVSAFDRRGVPRSNVRVSLDGESDVTGTDGRAHVRATVPGRRVLEANGPNGDGLRRLHVVALEDANRSHVVVESLAGPPFATDGRWSGSAVVANIGGAFHNGSIPLLLDGVPTNVSSVFLQPGDEARVTFDVSLLPGDHVIEGNGHEVRVTVAAAGTGGGVDATTGPKTLEDILRERRELSTRRLAPSSDATTAFLGETYENFNVALTVVVLATVLHSGLVVLVAVHRDLEERARNVGTLAALGAGRGSVRALAAKEFALVGGVAAVVGTAAGLLLARVAADHGLLLGFGHALAPRSDFEFGLRLVLVGLAMTLAAAVSAAERVRGRTARSLLSEGPARTVRPPLDELLGGAA